MQRKFIIGIGAVVAVAIGVAVYFIFFTGSAGVTVAPLGSTGLPTAGPGAPLPGETEGASGALPGAPVAVSARLMKISAGPVVPGVAVASEKAANASSSPPSTSFGTGDIAVKYIERQSGNVYVYLTHARTLTRTSNRTIPGIQSAAWLPDASLAFVRYLSGTDFSTINSYALPASGSLPTQAGGGFFLSQNLSDIAVSSTSVLTLASGVNGSVASLMRTDGTRASEIFTTPLSSLRIAFAGKNRYLAFTKPSYALSGSAFLVDGAGRFSRVSGPLNGLVAKASPSGKLVLVSSVFDGMMQMELVNTATGESLSLPVATIADKCVWAADDSAIYCGIPMNPSASFNYPDDWYQGAVSFSDRIWKIQVSGRYAQLVLDFSKENKEELDAEALVIDPLNTVLVFVNKNDGSLWSYSL